MKGGGLRRAEGKSGEGSNPTIGLGGNNEPSDRKNKRVGPSHVSKKERGEEPTRDLETE